MYLSSQGRHKDGGDFRQELDLHIREILNASLEENLELVYDTLKFFRTRARKSYTTLSTF